MLPLRTVTPLLVLALVSGQTFYEWVDASGQSHFTDDPSSIPANAKRRTTSGADVSVIPAPPRSAAKTSDPPRPIPPPTGPNLCERAEQKVRALEKKLEDARTREARVGKNCLGSLSRGGRASYARCMAAPVAKVDHSALEKELEDAREEHRKVKIDGCR